MSTRNYVNAKELLEEIVKSKFEYAYILNTYDYKKLGSPEDLQKYNNKKLYALGDITYVDEMSRVGKVIMINNAKGTALVTFNVREKPKLTNRAVALVMKMANHLSSALPYKYPEDKADCIQSALEDVLRYWKNFEPIRPNPDEETVVAHPFLQMNAFAYYTQMLKNGLAKGWKKLHKIKSVQRISISDDHGMYNI